MARVRTCVIPLRHSGDADIGRARNILARTWTALGSVQSSGRERSGISRVDFARTVR